jgi:hypothetical protein
MQLFSEKSLDKSDVSGEFGQPLEDSLAVDRLEFIPEAPRDKSNAVPKELESLLGDFNPQIKALVDFANDLPELLFLNVC